MERQLVKLEKGFKNLITKMTLENKIPSNRPRLIKLLKTFYYMGASESAKILSEKENEK